MARTLLLCVFFFPFAIAVLLAYGVGTAMPTHVLAAIAITIATAGISYATGKPRHWSPSSRLELTLALAELWLVVYAFIGSTTLFAYPLEMSDGTTAWCHTGTVSVAMSWTFCCFLSVLSVVLDATLIRFSRPRDNNITSLGLAS